MDREIDNIHRDLIITKEHICDLESDICILETKIKEIIKIKIFCLFLFIWTMYL